MGYLIEPTANYFVKFETLIRAADMQQLATAPYTLTSTIKAGFIFVPVSASIQVNGSTGYTTFAHLWIWQGGGTTKSATFARSLTNVLGPSKVCNFIVNVDHGTLPTNQFGNSIDGTRDFILKMDVDDFGGDGDGKVIMYGYYLPEFP
jgi:hypothetical protein